MALLDTLAGELLGPKSVGELSKAAGASSEQTQQLVAAALPLLLSGMYQNSATQEGAQSLSQALDRHAPDAQKSTSAMLSKADAQDGLKIVKHILGGDEKEVTRKLSQSTGLSQKQVSGMMGQLAPVVLSLVGSHKQEEQAASSGLAGLLGGALLGGGFQQAQQGGLNVANLAGALLGGSSSGSGNLLSGLLGGAQTQSASKPKKPKKPKKEEESGGLDLSGLLMGLLK